MLVRDDRYKHLLYISEEGFFGKEATCPLGMEEKQNQGENSFIGEGPNAR